ncbi:glycosyltransferase family 2 protein [Peribacillus muralis]|uniref:glycosyltransferase family 2 protein n=1 Tax=Peribacillus muralis TaxID=264697 RepID=UPI000A93A2D8|nr:glycosyltransferase family 2 protein [Peribacillus muralis]
MRLNIKVSVVIPVYNAGDYIEYCIKSLLNQTLYECEFIFINDGSIDTSKETIENYHQIDSRIILINQPNQGVSKARNNGLMLAKGEYVGFVDADDFVEEDMFEKLYRSAIKENYDSIISNFEIEINGHNIKTKFPFPHSILLDKEYIQTHIMTYFIKSDNLNSVCNKLYKNTLIKENNIRFPENTDLGEDGIFNLDFFSISNTSSYINYSGYYYREVLGSATRNIGEKDYFKKALEIYNYQIPKELFLNIKQTTIQKYKARKFIYSVLSYIHIYLSPTNDMSYFNRIKYVKSMLKNNSVHEALSLFSQERDSLGKYERLLLRMIKNKNLIGIYLATSYSRMRNK